MFGLILGIVAVILIVGSRLGRTLLALLGLAPFVILLAVAYFLDLAYKVGAPLPLAQKSTTGPDRPACWYVGTRVLLVNPKTNAGMAALVPGLVLIEVDSFADSLSKAVLVLVTVCLVDILWLV